MNTHIQTTEWLEAAKFKSKRQDYLRKFLALNPWMDVADIKYAPELGDRIGALLAMSSDLQDGRDLARIGVCPPPDGIADYALGIVPWSYERFGDGFGRTIIIGKEAFESRSDSAERELELVLRHDLYRQATAMRRGFNFPPTIDQDNKKDVHEILLPALLKLYSTKELLIVGTNTNLAHTDTFRLEAHQYLYALNVVQGTPPISDVEKQTFEKAPRMYPAELAGSTLEQWLQDLEEPEFVM